MSWGPAEFTEQPSYPASPQAHVLPEEQFRRRANAPGYWGPARQAALAAISYALWGWLLWGCAMMLCSGISVPILQALKAEANGLTATKQHKSS